MASKSEEGGHDVEEENVEGQEESFVAAAEDPDAATAEANAQTHVAASPTARGVGVAADEAAATAAAAATAISPRFRDTTSTGDPVGASSQDATSQQGNSAQRHMAGAGHRKLRLRRGRPGKV